jgi:hypothetical protein
MKYDDFYEYFPPHGRDSASKANRTNKFCAQIKAPTVLPQWGLRTLYLNFDAAYASVRSEVVHQANQQEGW